MINKRIIIFDLDDTLYKEVDFVKSAFRFISNRFSDYAPVNSIYNSLIDEYNRKGNPFNKLLQTYNIPFLREDLLCLYRGHFPNINLSPGFKDLLSNLYFSKDFSVGIITDGRSVTQKNKIRALELDKYVMWDDIIISEEFGSSKPNIKNYLFFKKKYPKAIFYYVGDNLLKDFISPNKLGWHTICIIDKFNINIHSQNIKVKNEYYPEFYVNDLSELKLLIHYGK